MEHVRNPHTTRTVGLDQMYKPLNLVDREYTDGSHVMFCDFRPTPEQLVQLLSGVFVVRLGIMGTVWPPCRLEVAERDSLPE
jgi:hypothetical protein